MADYITKIQTVDGNKQIDYKALANLPTSLPASDVKAWAKKTAPDTTLSNSGEAADAKTTGDKLSSLNENKLNKTVISSIINKSPTAETLDDFLEVQRNDKVYKVKVPKFASNPTTTCEKLGDNAGLSFTPSTDTVEGTDDYIDKVEFMWWHNNYVRNSNGDAIITALEGDDNYAETGAVDVGSCGMSFYYKFDETPDDHIMLTWSPSPHEELGLIPFSGNVPGHSYWCLSAYPSITASDGLLRSQPNGKIARNQSYSNMITNYKKKGAGYYGAGAERNTFQIIFNMLMGATKSSQSLYAGVTNWNFQYEAAVQRSTNATYFPVTASQASNLEVGCYVSVGYGSNDNGFVNKDRGVSSMYKYADDVKILRIEDMDDGNKAVYLDVSTGFNTMPVALTDSLSAPITMSSMHMWTGETNKVIGKHNGSAVSNSSGRHSYRVQGVEYALGAYIVASDAVMVFKSDYSKDVYVAPKGVTHSTSESTIKSTYKLIGNVPSTSSGGDYWVGDVDIDEETGGWNPSAIGASNSQGMGDMVYAGGKSTSGTREYMQGGSLWDDSDAGSSCLSCWHALSHAYWDYCGCD